MRVYLSARCCINGFVPACLRILGTSQTTKEPISNIGFIISLIHIILGCFLFLYTHWLGTRSLRGLIVHLRWRSKAAHVLLRSHSRYGKKSSRHVRVCIGTRGLSNGFVSSIGIEVYGLKDEFVPGPVCIRTRSYSKSCSSLCIWAARMVGVVCSMKLSGLSAVLSMVYRRLSDN